MRRSQKNSIWRFTHRTVALAVCASLIVMPGPYGWSRAQGRENPEDTEAIAVCLAPISAAKSEARRKEFEEAQLSLSRVKRVRAAQANGGSNVQARVAAGRLAGIAAGLLAAIPGMLHAAQKEPGWWQSAAHRLSAEFNSQGVFGKTVIALGVAMFTIILWLSIAEPIGERLKKWIWPSKLKRWKIPDQGLEGNERLELSPTPVLAWHSERVGNAMRAVAERLTPLRFDEHELEICRMSGYSHDIWKEQKEALGLVRRLTKLTIQERAQLEVLAQEAERMLAERSENADETPIHVTREERWLVRHHRAPLSILTDIDIPSGSRSRLFSMCCILHVVNEMDTAIDRSHPYRIHIPLSQMGPYLETNVLTPLRDGYSAYLKGDGERARKEEGFNTFLQHLGSSVCAHLQERDGRISGVVAGKPLVEQVSYLVQINTDMERFWPYTQDDLIKRLNLSENDPRRAELPGVLHRLTEEDKTLTRIHGNKYVWTENVPQLSEAALLLPYKTDQGLEEWMEATDCFERLNDGRIFEVLRWPAGRDHCEEVYVSPARLQAMEQAQGIYHWIDGSGSPRIIERSAMERLARESQSELVGLLANPVNPNPNAWFLRRDLQALLDQGTIVEFRDIHRNPFYMQSEDAQPILSNANAHVVYYSNSAGGTIVIPAQLVALPSLLQSGEWVRVLAGDQGLYRYARADMVQELERNGHIAEVQKLTAPGGLETGYVTREYGTVLEQNNILCPARGELVSIGDRNSPSEIYIHRVDEPALLQNGLFKKARVDLQREQPVLASAVDALMAEGCLYSALMSGDEPSLRGVATLVLEDGISERKLRQGMRLHTLKNVIDLYNTPEERDLIYNAYELARQFYGPKGSEIAVGYLMDDAIEMATLIADPVNVRVPAYLVAAALLFRVRPQSIKQAIESGQSHLQALFDNVPQTVWDCLSHLDQLNAIEYIPPRKIGDQKRKDFKDFYAHNFINLILKMTGDDAETLILYVVYKYHDLQAMKKMAEAKDEDVSEVRFNRVTEVGKALALELGLTDFSGKMDQKAFETLREEDNQMVLKLIRDTFGVDYQDLSLYPMLLEEQIRLEIEELRQAGVVIDAKYKFNVKGVPSIFSKLERYARQGRGLRDFHDLVRGKIILEGEANKEVLKQIPTIRKLGDHENVRKNAAGLEVRGCYEKSAVFTTAEGPCCVIRDDLLDQIAANVARKTGKHANEIKKKAAALMKTLTSNLIPEVFQTEIAMQNEAEEKAEQMGSHQHIYYEERRAGYATRPVQGRQQTAKSIDEVRGALRAKQEDPDIRDFEYVRFRYKEDGKWVEYPHGLPKPQTPGELPTVADLLARQKPEDFERIVMLGRKKMCVGQNEIESFGKRIATGNVVCLEEEDCGRNFENEINALIAVRREYQECLAAADKKKRDQTACQQILEEAARRRQQFDQRLPVTNAQARVSRAMLLKGYNEERRTQVYDRQKREILRNLRTDRKVSDFADEKQLVEFMSKRDGYVWQWMIARGFRGSKLVFETCMGLDTGEMQMKDVLDVICIALGRERLAQEGVAAFSEENWRDQIQAIITRKPRLVEGKDWRTLCLKLGMREVALQEVLECFEARGREILRSMLNVDDGILQNDDAMDALLDLTASHLDSSEIFTGRDDPKKDALRCLAVRLGANALSVDTVRKVLEDAGRPVTSGPRRSAHRHPAMVGAAVPRRVVAKVTIEDGGVRDDPSLPMKNSWQRLQLMWSDASVRYRLAVDRSDAVFFEIHEGDGPAGAIHGMHPDNTSDLVIEVSSSVLERAAANPQILRAVLAHEYRHRMIARDRLFEGRVSQDELRKPLSEVFTIAGEIADAWIENTLDDSIREYESVETPVNGKRPFTELLRFAQAHGRMDAALLDKIVEFIANNAAVLYPDIPAEAIRMLRTEGLALCHKAEFFSAVFPRLMGVVQNTWSDEHIRFFLRRVDRSLCDQDARVAVDVGQTAHHTMTTMRHWLNNFLQSALAAVGSMKEGEPPQELESDLSALRRAMNALLKKMIMLKMIKNPDGVEPYLATAKDEFVFDEKQMMDASRIADPQDPALEPRLEAVRTIAAGVAHFTTRIQEYRHPLGKFMRMTEGERTALLDDLQQDIRVTIQRLADLSQSDARYGYTRLRIRNAKVEFPGLLHYADPTQQDHAQAMSVSEVSERYAEEIIQDNNRAWELAVYAIQDERDGFRILEQMINKADIMVQKRWLRAVLGWQEDDTPWCQLWKKEKRTQRDVDGERQLRRAGQVLTNVFEAGERAREKARADSARYPNKAAELVAAMLKDIKLGAAKKMSFLQREEWVDRQGGRVEELVRFFAALPPGLQNEVLWVFLNDMNDVRPAVQMQARQTFRQMVMALIDIVLAYSSDLAKCSSPEGLEEIRQLSRFIMVATAHMRQVDSAGVQEMVNNLLADPRLSRNLLSMVLEQTWIGDYLPAALKYTALVSRETAARRVEDIYSLGERSRQLLVGSFDEDSQSAVVFILASLQNMRDQGDSHSASELSARLSRLLTSMLANGDVCLTPSGNVLDTRSQDLQEQAA